MHLSHKKFLIITTVITLIFYVYNVNSWKFAFVGDDWPFYQFAEKIIAGHFLFYPFSFSGVYNQNSVLSSMYQALVMFLLGPSNFSWRFSNIVLIIPITIFTYLWLKKVFNPTIALISTLVLQSSFYLANFFKVGKNMPQALAMLTACLFMTAKSVEKPTRLNFFILGVLLGVSFYIYIGPIFPLIIWPFFLPLLRKDKLRLLFSRGIFLALGYAMLVLLSFIDVNGFNGPLGKTFAHKEYEGYKPMFVNILHNFLLFFKNFDYLFNHFVAGPYVDFITAGCIIIGLIIVFKKIRTLPYLMLLLSYVSLCVIIGITSPYSYSPTTRGIFFLPFGAAFAGIALSYLAKKRMKTLVTLLVSIFCFNVYFSQIGVFEFTGYSATALVVREMQLMQAREQKEPITLVLPDDTPYFGLYYYETMQRAYGLQDISVKAVKTNVLQCSDIDSARVIMFVQDIRALHNYAELNCPVKAQPAILYSAIYL